MKNFYQVLNVAPNSSDFEIKQSYEYLKNRINDFNELLRVEQAYSFLSERRAEYNVYLMLDDGYPPAIGVDPETSNKNVTFVDNRSMSVNNYNTTQKPVIDNKIINNTDSLGVFTTLILYFLLGLMSVFVLVFVLHFI